MSKPIPFSKLQPGERFEFEGEVWRKLEAKSLVTDNAQMLRLRQTRNFQDNELVAPHRPPHLSLWRRWLVSRSLRWQVAGFTWWARWSWRMSRMMATEKTHQALAAHATTLLMMGE
jgi:hypothetical protein